MMLTLSFCWSAKRTALPSGSRRAAPKYWLAPAVMRSTEMSTGCLNCTISTPLETRTSASISTSRRTTRRP